ncbi:MAG: lipid-A-disaccharide synthase, partial [Leptolyngbya sp. SIO3F4]|nr:lipid-A-disaccharide synthase [Leptolyngbya sp. SIO3F4]
VCYKGSPVSYLIARKLVKVPYISLVNLVMEKELVKELIQDQLTHEALVNELQRLLPGESHRLEVLEGYAELRERLGGAGASEKTAASLLKTLRESR